MSKITYKVEVYGGGNIYWHLNDEIHREDGPAVEYSNGNKAWFLNGTRHREDGPAVEHSNGDKSWYLNDVEYTEEGFNEKMSSVVEMTIAEIEELVGKKVKVVK